MSLTEAPLQGLHFVEPVSVHPKSRLESEANRPFDTVGAAPEPVLPRTSELALRINDQQVLAALSQAVTSFNRQSEVDDAQRPPTAPHPIYQDLRRLTVTLRIRDTNTLELCLGVRWYSRLRREPWLVTLARVHLHSRAIHPSTQLEAQTQLHIRRETPMLTALRTVSTLLRPSVYLAGLALVTMPFLTLWPLWLASIILAFFVMATFFPAYWKMAIRSHALPALDALVTASLRDHLHRTELPEPYRDRSESSS